MNKNEFLETLRKKLSILESSEVDDIILEYSNHIDQKIKDGKKEKEAVAAFGNIDDLAKEILRGYKISDTYSSNDLLNNLIKFFRDLVNSAEREFNNFAKNNNLDITNTLISILICIAGIFVVNIFVSVLDHLGRAMFNGNILFGFDNPVSIIWIITINIVRALIIAAIIYSTYCSVVNHSSDTNSQNKKNKETKTTKPKKEKNIDSSIKEPIITEYNDSKEQLSALRIIVNIFAALVSIPFIFTIIGLFIILSVFIGLMFKGIVFIGVTIILIGLIFIFSSITSILFRLIGGKE